MCALLFQFARPFWLLLALLLLAPVGQAGGAALLEFRVTPDGSVEPPGDLLELGIYWTDLSLPLQLEVRGFARMEGGETVTPVPGRGEDWTDPEGNLRRIVLLRPPAEGRVSRLKLVIPYAALRLPLGSHELGYEVTARSGRETAFVQASALAPILVGRQPRMEMTQEVERRVAARVTERVEALVLEQGELRTREVEMEREQQRPVLAVRTHRVEIPGGMIRPQVLFAKEFPDPDMEPEAAAVAPLEGEPWAPLSAFEPESRRLILFATNRALRRGARLSAESFLNAAGPELLYGVGLVNIPVQTHQRGKLETPTSWWERADPRKHFLIEKLELFDREEFLRRAGPDDLLLIVHGYNTNFNFAVLRAAQIAHDLHFPGRTLAYSWPSAGSTGGYGHDEEQTPAAAEALSRLLGELVEGRRERESPGEIHVISHSMGNRVLLAAMRQLELEHQPAEGGKYFGHMTLAAPDVDAATFAALLPSTLRLARRTTLYYCPNDRALLASQTLHLNKPVGLAPFFAEGLDTINAENANTSFLGHGYYAADHQLLLDLRLATQYAMAPGERLPPLAPRTLVLGYPHWSFAPRP